MNDFEKAVALVYNEAVALMWKAIDEGHTGGGISEMTLCEALERTWPDAVQKAREEVADDSPKRPLTPDYDPKKGRQC